MNPSALRYRTGAFTLVEMLTVIAVIAILAALLLPVLNKSQMRAKRIVCENNLGQVGLAFHVFSNDHSGKFPMAVSTNDGGSMEFVASGFDAGEIFYTCFYHFQSLSGELAKPSLLICPADLRVAATSFPALQNENVSFFVGVGSTFDKPESILAGDRNLATNSFEHPTILQVGPVSNLGWTWEMHQFKGNVLFADSHVEEWNNSSLAAAASQSSANQSLFLPSVVTVDNTGFGGGGNGGGSGGGGGSGQGGGSGSGSTGQSDGSSGNSGSGSTAQSGGSSLNSSSSSAAQSSAPPASQPAQSQGMSSSENKPLYSMRTDSQPSPTTGKAPTVPAASTEVNDTTVSPGADTDSGMSSFDRHLMKSVQHTFEWIYLLLLLLLLLYLAYKIRQWTQRRAARQRASDDSSVDM
jgi:prepilin-type N-terminal cleavage/methylation domain-containing protein/prepilin-type processing-associated H-X9-DG protein